MNTRWKQDNPLTMERLKAFVGIDKITAQMPLIEVTRKKWPVRIWTAYDLSRTIGTVIEIWGDGMVKTVTIYPSRKRHEQITRPPDENRGVRKEKKLHSAVPKSKRFKGVHEGKKTPRAKGQRHDAGHMAQDDNLSSWLTKGLSEEE